MSANKSARVANVIKTKKVSIFCLLMTFKCDKVSQWQCIICFLVFNFLSWHVAAEPIITDKVPKFGEPMTNLTVPVQREAVFTCVVDDLGSFKLAWLRVDTQTILTIHTHVITKNHRIAVTRSDYRTWYLHIKDVRESDRGWYMCQINTDPMKSQTSYLEVVVPPDIIDDASSTDLVAREGTNVTLKCSATGSPQPNITWRREGGEAIPLSSGQEVASVDGPVLNITKVNRLQMGPYLCIASNGVPPSVSKRIMLVVHFPPMIWIQNQLVGAYEGQHIVLECFSEAYPKSINYWTKDKGEIISQNSKYEPTLIDNTYKVHMKLTIRSVTMADYGTYKCVSKNSLGDTDGTIKLYYISAPSTTTIRTTTTTMAVRTTTIKDVGVEDGIKVINASTLPVNKEIDVPLYDLSKEKDRKMAPPSEDNFAKNELLEDSARTLDMAQASRANWPKNAGPFCLIVISFSFLTSLSCR